ncbi:chaplin [Streptomyces goshikiensis]|uniref:chaplin n=1 Tax=Streptomyces goshikiensis TaxID=1942 RepID=UPI00367D76EE
MMSLKKSALVLAAACLVACATAGSAAADADPFGIAANSPGFLSGNVVQMPFHMQINTCGNATNNTGLFNPAFNNTCIND